MLTQEEYARIEMLLKEHEELSFPCPAPDTFDRRTIGAYSIVLTYIHDRNAPYTYIIEGEQSFVYEHAYYTLQEIERDHPIDLRRLRPTEEWEEKS